MKKKKCTNCLRELPITEFYYHVTNLDHHCGICKACQYERKRHPRINLPNYTAIPKGLTHPEIANPTYVEIWAIRIIETVSNDSELRDIAKAFKLQGQLRIFHKILRQISRWQNNSIIQTKNENSTANSFITD